MIAHSEMEPIVQQIANGASEPASLLARTVAGRTVAWSAGQPDPEAVAEELEEELEWEDWNGRGSFVHHMIAGSAAGVVEHLCMFPLDTYKTHQQTYFAQQAASGSAARAAVSVSGPAGKAAAAAAAGTPQLPPNFFEMVRRDGFLRLWRGAPAVLLGCIPSHAAYFSAYEFGRERFGLNDANGGHQPVAAGATGALATILHDGILTPMDVVKQRLQLGYYSGVANCLRSVIRDEGWASLWRSYPTTLLMNVPYAAAVVAANESFKQVFIPVTGQTSMLTYILSGAGAGAIAAAVTCPLDVVKTRLQTAAVLGLGLGRGGGAGSGGSAGADAGSTKAASASSSSSNNSSVLSMASRAVRNAAGSAGQSAGPSGSAMLQPQVAFLYTAAGGAGAASDGVKAAAAAYRPPGALDIARTIWREEGARGFFRGVRARMGVHTPSQAISWATYEAMRNMLVTLSGGSASATRD